MLFVCLARYDWRDIMFPGCLSVLTFVCLWKQHDLDVHVVFCVDLDLHITSSRSRV